MCQGFYLFNTSVHFELEKGVQGGNCANVCAYL